MCQLHLNLLSSERPRQLCVVVADMTRIKSIDLEETSTSGGKYKAYKYEIILYFGGPELKAQTCWMDEVSLVITFLCECL